MRPRRAKARQFSSVRRGEREVEERQSSVGPGTSPGLSRWPPETTGKVARETTPCWLVKVRELPLPCCCDTPPNLMVARIVESHVPAHLNRQPPLGRKIGIAHRILGPNRSRGP